MATEKKAIMLRYPADLVKTIDDQIEKGRYLSRSDYFVTRSRILMSHVWLAYTTPELTVITVDDDMGLDDYQRAHLDTFFIQYFGSMLYSKYSGPIVSISVQFPVQLYRDIVDLCDIVDYFSGVQDFIKASIFFKSITEPDMDDIRAKSNRIKETKPTQEWVEKETRKIQRSYIKGQKDLTDNVWGKRKV